MRNLATRFRGAAALLAAAAALAACGDRADAPAPTATAPASAAPEKGLATAADGADIAWWRRGKGDTALLFIHGWSCDREFWREQIDAFDDAYTVVTLDLPGHGASGGDREPWRVRDYGADVVAVADALDLDRVVLVGHSMGGLVALEAAARLGDRAVAVIAADSLHDAEAYYPAEETAPMLAAFRADYAQAAAAMFDGMSGQTMDPELAGWIADKAAGSRPEVGIGLLEDYTDREFVDLFRDAGVPIRAINAPAGPVIPETRIESNRRYADFDAVIVEDVGHFLQLEAPERFNAALRDTLAALESG